MNFWGPAANKQDNLFCTQLFRYSYFFTPNVNCFPLNAKCHSLKLELTGISLTIKV
jgi:hypothetical protein